MTPAAIIRGATADGVSLALSPAGTIKATGEGAAVKRWLGTIRERKTEIAEALRAGAGDTAPVSRWWVIHYPNRGSVQVACCPVATHAEVMDQYPAAVAAEPFSPATHPPAPPMSAGEEHAIRSWLRVIGEDDAGIVEAVLAQCQENTAARDYFLSRSAAEVLGKENDR